MNACEALSLVPEICELRGVAGSFIPVLLNCNDLKSMGHLFVAHICTPNCVSISKSHLKTRFSPQDFSVLLRNFSLFANFCRYLMSASFSYNSALSLWTFNHRS